MGLLLPGSFVRVSFVLEWTLIDLRRKWMLRSMTLKKNPALNFVDPPRLSEVAISTLLPRAGMLSTGSWVCSNTWECRDLPFFSGCAQNAGQAEDESWEWERKGMGWERLTMTSLPLHWGWGQECLLSDRCSMRALRHLLSCGFFRICQLEA